MPNSPIEKSKQGAWKKKSLGSCASIKARIGWQGLTTKEYLDSGAYYLITGTDFVDGRIDWNNCHFVSKDRFDQDPNIKIQKGDVLVTKDGTIGKVAFLDKIPGPGTLNSGVFVIRSKDQHLSQRYLAKVFVSKYFDDFIDSIVAGSTIVHLYQKDIVNFSFMVPPTVEEQERIADTLESIDALLIELDAYLDKKKAIREGVLQQLISGTTRLSGFSEKWNEVLFKSIYKFAKEGGTPSTSVPAYYQPATIPFAKIEDLKNKYLTRVDTYISESGMEHSSAWLLPVNSVILSNGATLGEVSINKIPTSTKQGIIGIILKEQFDPEFIYYLFKGRHFRREMERVTTHGTMDCAYIKDLNTIPLSIPSLPEQKAIATVLSSIDEEIVWLEKQRDKYALIKQGMMQELLTGKTRLL